MNEGVLGSLVRSTSVVVVDNGVPFDCNLVASTDGGGDPGCVVGGLSGQYHRQVSVKMAWDTSGAVGPEIKCRTTGCKQSTAKPSKVV